MMPRRKLTANDKAAILARYQHRCGICREAFADGAEIDFDHEIPLEIGGKDDASNMQPVHRACHKVKTARDAKLIAKSRRIRAKMAGTVTRKKAVIRSRGFRKDIRRTLAGKTVPREGPAVMR